MTVDAVHEWLFEFTNYVGTVLARYTADGSNVVIDGDPTTRTTEAAYIDEVVYRVSAEGDCIDASWLGGDSDGVLAQVAPQTRVNIYRRGTRTGEDPALWYPRWSGVVTLCPSAVRADGMPGRYRAVGWSTVLYEVDSGTNIERAAGSDLAVYWNQKALFTPAPLTQPTRAATGLTVLGAVNADSVSLGQFYDALARLGAIGGLDLRPIVTGARESLLVEASTAKATLEATDPVDVETWEVQGPDNVQNVRWLLGDGTMTNETTGGSGAVINRQTPNVKTHLSSSPSGGIIIGIPGGKTGLFGGTRLLTPPEGQEVLVPLLDPALWQSANLVPFLAVTSNSVSALSYEDGGSADAGITLAATVALGAGVTSLSVSALAQSVPAGAVLAFPCASFSSGWLLFRVSTLASAGATTILGEQLSGQANSGAVGVRFDRALVSGQGSRVEFSAAVGGSGGQFGVYFGVYATSAFGIVDALAYDVAVTVDSAGTPEQRRGTIVAHFGRGGEVILGNSSPGSIPASLSFNGTSGIPMPVAAGNGDALQRFTGVSLLGDSNSVNVLSGERFYAVQVRAQSVGVAGTLYATLGYVMPLAVDGAALDALAEAEYSVPTLSAFRARVYARDPEPVGLLDVNLASGGTVTDAPVSVVEYALRGNEGASAVYVCGERERPEVSAFTRAVRDRDIRSSTRAAKAGARGQA